MAKNAYANTLRKAKDNSYSKGVWDGMRMGFNIAAIKLNHRFGFGDGRLSQLEADVQDYVNEIVDVNDPLVTKVRIERELKRIRGEGWEME